MNNEFFNSKIDKNLNINNNMNDMQENINNSSDEDKIDSNNINMIKSNKFKENNISIKKNINNPENKLSNINRKIKLDLPNNLEDKIGIDNNSRVIVKAPFLNNYGYWTDNNMTLKTYSSYFDIKYIDKEIFDFIWGLELGAKI